MTKIAGRDVGTPDLLILGTGVAGVVNLFLPWYRLGTDEDLSISEGRRALEFFGLPDDLRASHLSANAFAAGLLATFAAVLIVAVAGLVATRLWAGFPGRDGDAARPEQLGAALSALALLVLLLKLWADHEWLAVGFFVALALAAAQVTLSLVALRGVAPRASAETDAGQRSDDAEGAAPDSEPGQ